MSFGFGGMVLGSGALIERIVNIAMMSTISGRSMKRTREINDEKFRRIENSHDEHMCTKSRTR